MDKTFFNDLCKQEAQLVEKLRILREFKNTFFDSNIDIEKASAISKASITIPQQSIFPAKKKEYKRTSALTVPKMVLKSLAEVGIGSTHDIASKLIHLYPSVSYEKASKDAKHHLSLLSKAGQVKIIERRKGKLGYIYQSIETNNNLE
jgi:hypothetical protein